VSYLPSASRCTSQNRRAKLDSSEEITHPPIVEVETRRPGPRPFGGTRVRGTHYPCPCPPPIPYAFRAALYSLRHAVRACRRAMTTCGASGATHHRRPHRCVEAHKREADLLSSATVTSDARPRLPSGSHLAPRERTPASGLDEGLAAPQEAHCPAQPAEKANRPGHLRLLFEIVTEMQRGANGIRPR
jgi:hypothetical protein